MNLFKHSITTFVSVIIDGKAYKYPKDMPIPRIGETVSVCGSKFGIVTRVLHQVEDNTLRMITISTKVD